MSAVQLLSQRLSDHLPMRDVVASRAMFGTHLRAACGAALIAVLLACSPAPPHSRRVLVIGVDGAAPQLVSSMMEEGLLPNLAALAADGLYGRIASEKPLLSPRIWTTVATGKSVQKHGIENFVMLDERGVKRLYMSADRKTHALWNMVSDRGLTVGVVNWMMTHPAENLNGVMVSDHAVPGILNFRHNLAKLFADVVFPTVEGPVLAPRMKTPVASPEAWQPIVQDLVDNRETLTEFADPFEGAIGFSDGMPLPIMSYVFGNDALVARTALRIQREIEPDLLMVYLPGIDRVSHWLWGNLEPAEKYPEDVRPSASEREVGAAALRRYYRYTDALVGMLVEGYSSQDLIVVLSDHGFEGGTTAVSTQTGVHESDEASEGVFFVRAPDLKPDAALDGIGVRDITPTVLGWLGLPTARDQTGRFMPLFEIPTPQQIDTYDTTEITRIGSGVSGEEESMLEHLRELGYVE